MINPDLQALQKAAQEIESLLGNLPSSRGVQYEAGCNSTGWAVFCNGKTQGKSFHSPLTTIRKDGCEARGILQADLAEAIALFLAHGYEIMGLAQKQILSQMALDALATAPVVEPPAAVAAPPVQSLKPKESRVPFLRLDENRVIWLAPDTPVRFGQTYTILRSIPDSPEEDPEVWVNNQWTAGWLPNPESLVDHSFVVRFRGLGWDKNDLEKLRNRLENAFPTDRSERDRWPAFSDERVAFQKEIGR